MARNRFSLSLDHRRLSEIINRHIHAGMERAADHLVKVMEKEVILSAYGNGPGHSDWRKEMIPLIHVAFRKIAENDMEFGVGIIPEDVFTHIKAMLIAYGSGSEAGGEPLHTGPKGRPVFDSDFVQKRSERDEHPLPKKFNQEGNDWINKSMGLIKKDFHDFIVNAWLGIPESELAQCIKFEVR